MTSRRSGSTEGFTLVEVIIATGIASLVFIVIGSLMISLFTAQRIVGTATLSANQVQSVARGITDTVNNASHLQLTTPTGSDQLLVVRVAGSNPSGPAWGCVAWYYSATALELRTRSGPVGTAITAPTVTDLATWRVVLTGVRPVTGAAIMSTVANGVSLTFEVGDVLVTTAATRPGYAVAAPDAANRCF